MNYFEKEAEKIRQKAEKLGVYVKLSWFDQHSLAIANFLALFIVIGLPVILAFVLP